MRPPESLTAWLGSVCLSPPGSSVAPAVQSAPQSPAAQPAADDAPGSQAASTPAARDDYRNNNASTTGSQPFEAAPRMPRQLPWAAELFTIERRGGGPSPMLS